MKGRTRWSFKVPSRVGCSIVLQFWVQLSHPFVVLGCQCCHYHTAPHTLGHNPADQRFCLDHEHLSAIRYLQNNKSKKAHILEYWNWHPAGTFGLNNLHNQQFIAKDLGLITILCKPSHLWNLFSFYRILKLVSLRHFAKWLVYN